VSLHIAGWNTTATVSVVVSHATKAHQQIDALLYDFVWFEKKIAIKDQHLVQK
jgi:hypothetical protein